MKAARCLPLLLLAACAAPAPKPAPGPAVPPPAPPLAASYDWHVLLLAPFGATLKDLPFKLHEVLLFADPKDAAAGDGAECFGLEHEPPRFLERTPDEYLLCFRHDHLARIEATVHVPQASAGQILADACGLWKKNASPPPAGPPAAPNHACSGRDGGIDYRGGLDEESEESDLPLSIRLDDPEQP